MIEHDSTEIPGLSSWTVQTFVYSIKKRTGNDAHKKETVFLGQSLFFLSCVKIYLTPTSSSSKTRSVLGGIPAGCPCSPYPR